MNALVQLLIAVCVLICIWFVVERFSPDPLITKISKIIIFVLALLLVVKLLLPMVGVSF